MVSYRRNRVSGGTYFFTVTLRDRSSGLLIERVDLLRRTMREVKRHKPYRVEAIVVLPDHLHAIWTLPENDSDYSGRWRRIKGLFSRCLRDIECSIARNARGEYDVWQRRFWEHTIRDDTDLQRHVDYIHYNPVRHGYVQRVADWPYSSFHRYVRMGWLPTDWGGDHSYTSDRQFGE